MIIAGLALTAGSIAANIYAHSQVDSWRNEVPPAELSRQQGYDTHIDDLNTQSQDRFVGWEDQQDQRTDHLASPFASSVEDLNIASVLPAATSNIVNKETANQNVEAQAYAGQQPDARKVG